MEFPVTKDMVGVAKEWAAKLLASRLPVGPQDDYFPEDTAAAADRQAAAIAGLLPDAVRCWAHRSGRSLESVTGEQRRAMAAAIAATVREAAAAQVSIDAATCGVVNRRDW